MVKTVSGSVASWPATGNVTTKPLPIIDDIQRIVDKETGEVAIGWVPNPESEQDNYKVGTKEFHLFLPQAFAGGIKPFTFMSSQRMLGCRLEL